jgi:hypothetical protein
MVIIDAEKHNLNYKESYRQNGIQELAKKYQGSSRGGAVTLISKGGGKVSIPRRVDRKASEGGAIDKDTGEEYIHQLVVPIRMHRVKSYLILKK